MNTGNDDTIDPTREPPFRQGAEGPAGEALRARAELLKAFGVQFDGRVYRCRGRRFERFSDALAHARQVAGIDGPHDGSGPHKQGPDSSWARRAR